MSIGLSTRVIGLVIVVAMLFALPLLGYVFVWSCVFSAPVILLLLIGRNRINRTAGGALLAGSFACASAYMLWRIEWFDVWRHGTPPLSQLFIYACYSALYGAVGWLIAGTVLRRGSVSTLNPSRTVVRG